MPLLRTVPSNWRTRESQSEIGMTMQINKGLGWAYDGRRALTAGAIQPTIGDSCNLSGGVTASTGTFAVKRHAGAHTPVIECKTIIANQELAYAA